MRASLTQKLKPEAIEFLQANDMAVGVGDVARHLDVSLSTVRQLLMELLVEGKAAKKTTTIIARQMLALVGAASTCSTGGYTVANCI